MQGGLCLQQVRDGKYLIFWGTFSNLCRVLSGNEAAKFLVFGFFFVTHNVRFTKIICISMPNQLNVFFLAFFMIFNFLAF